MKIEKVQNNVENKININGSTWSSTTTMNFEKEGVGVDDHIDPFNEKGITLIALIITIILMLILAGVVLNVTLGENGLFKTAKQAGKDYEIAGIIEKLEVEKANLITELTGDLPSVDEYINYLISKNIINEADVTDIDDNTKEIVIDKYVFFIEKEESGNIKITYSGPATNEPRIGKISIVKTTVGSIKIKVIASKVDGGDYKYYIKNVTTGEEYSETPTVTLKENEYEFTELERENRYKIKVELVNSNGKAEKETEEIETVPTKVNSITLNKTSIELEKGSTDTTLTLTIKPDDAEDKSVTWTSSDESIATVAVNGDTITITGVKAGNANITVTANDGSNKNATCKVTVTPPPPPEIGEIGDTHSASQIIYTWEELGEIAKVVSDNYGYGEGQINEDTAEITVTAGGKTSKLGIGDTTTVNDIQVRILGFNHDPLVNANAYGEGNNSYAGISFEFVECLTTAKMNSGNTYAGGWNDTVLRNTLNSTIYESLENNKYIKQVVKQYIKTAGDANSVSEAYDKIWLLSCSEIWNGGYQGGYGYTVTKEGERYKFYKNINATWSSNNSKLIKNLHGGGAVTWWLRSPNGGQYCWCTCNGGASNNSRADVSLRSFTWFRCVMFKCSIL